MKESCLLSHLNIVRVTAIDVDMIQFRKHYDADGPTATIGTLVKVAMQQ